jgi:hypothetical protein
VCPGLAHRTVQCATGQCPVHQGTQLRTAHLWEFWESLRYNSPDCPVCQRSNDYYSANGRLQQQLMRYIARRSRSRARRRTGQSTGPVRCTTGLSGDRDVRSSNGQNPTAGLRGWRTGQCPVAHRTVRCAIRQKPSPTVLLLVGAINTPQPPHFNASKFSAFKHLTRAIAFNTRHNQRDQIVSQVQRSFQSNSDS